MVSLYMLAILCCHTIDWDIFLRYWCLSQIYYIISSINRKLSPLCSLVYILANMYDYNTVKHWACFIICDVGYIDTEITLAMPGHGYPQNIPMLLSN